MSVFAVDYTYPPEKAALRDEHRPAHREWLSNQLDAGRVLIAGPYADGSGGLFLVRADDLADATGLMTADPFAINDAIGAVRVVEWTPVFGPITG